MLVLQIFFVPVLVFVHENVIVQLPRKIVLSRK